MKKNLLIFLIASFSLSKAQYTNNYSIENNEESTPNYTLLTSSEDLLLDSVCNYNKSSCWTYQSKELNTYRNQNLFEKCIYTKNVLTSKDSCFYNESSQIIKKYQFSYNSSNGLINLRKILDYIYGPQHKPILIITTDSTLASNVSVTRDTFEYINNLKVYSQSDRYYGTFLSSSNYYEWNYNINNLNTEYYTGTISGATKTPSTKDLYEYNGNNKICTKRYNWNTTLSDWEFIYTDSISYDENGNAINVKRYNFIKEVNALQPVYQDQTMFSDNNVAVYSIRYNWNFYFWKEYSKSIYFYKTTQNLISNWADLCDNNKFNLLLSAITCPSSIQKNKVNSFGSPEIFPNPSDGSFSINFNNKKNGNYTLSIFSTDGKLVYSEDISAPMSDFSKVINLKSVKNGVYSVQLRSEKEIYKERILVIKK